MEKKTIDTLRVMLCGEIDEIAKKGSLSHETLDILKDLVETEKNLAKIEKYTEEKEEKEQKKKMDMGMNMDNGYSQRKYYIDADYDPRQSINSYARGGNNSYGYPMGNGNYAMDNSYMYDPRMNQMPMYSMARDNSYARGYSRNGSKQEMVTELQEMMNETQDMKVREAIQKVMAEMNK